jgi:hypothetical protein
MAFIIPKSENFTYTPKPTGKFKARLIQLIDLGTQTSTFEGKEKAQRKFMLTFETPENTKVFDETRGEQPFVYSREFTMSWHEKGSLRPFVEEWIETALSDEEANSFDLETLIDTPCEIKTMEKKSKTDPTRSSVVLVRVEAIKEAPKARNPILIFNLDQPSDEIFNQLPNWLKEKIAKSPEFEKWQNKKSQVTEKPKTDLPAVDEVEINLEEITTQMPF